MYLPMKQHLLKDQSGSPSSRLKRLNYKGRQSRDTHLLVYQVVFLVAVFFLPYNYLECHHTPRSQKQTDAGPLSFKFFLSPFFGRSRITSHLMQEKK